MRTFELVEGTSAKFWEVEVRGDVLVVRFGRLGTAGQTKEKAFASAALAAKEAEKLIREKLGKGYGETGASASKAETPAATIGETEAPAKAAKVAKPAAPAKAAKVAKPAAPLMPVPGLDDPRPGTFAVTAELDALYAQGWPNLRVLTDEVMTPAALRRKALAALQAIDPVLPTIVPRALARLVLVGYPYHPFNEEAAVAAALASDRPVDEALLREVVREKFGRFSGRDETYPFRMLETVFLFECFLGAETVAEVLVEHLLRASRELALWGEGAFWIDHENANFRRVVPALGWLRLRLAAERWQALTKPLRKGNPKLPRFSATLRAVADDAAPLEETVDPQAFALQRRDAAAVRALLVDRWPFDDAAQCAYVCGEGWLMRAPTKGLTQHPKWAQERLLAEIGTVRSPGVVRVIGALAASRSVGPTAAAWLAAHRDWVEAEALPALAQRPADAAVVAAVRASLAGEAKAPAATPAQLRKDLARVFTELPAQMKACGDDLERERAAMRAAIDRYTEIRAAQGEVIPEAYFTHQLDLDWGADEERVQRWIDIAVDVA